MQRGLESIVRAAALAGVAVLAWSGIAAGGERAPLQVGDAFPALDFVDIEGEAVGKDYRSWVQVVTFADRESSERLKGWMGDAQMRATKAHPDLAVAYMSFADLAAVPGFMRRVVRPLLRRSFENSNQELVESYRKAGVAFDPEKVAYRFIPDWDGAYLEAFGLENAETYHGWIVFENRVVAAFDASTPDPAMLYGAVFDRLDPRAGMSEVRP